MRIQKKNLNEALKVLGKVVCQTSPVELYRSVRFVGTVNEVRAMATDGVETVEVLSLDRKILEKPPNWNLPVQEELFSSLLL